MTEDQQFWREKVRQRNLEGYQWHIFLCKGPKCCSLSKGTKVWDYLKKRLEELSLSEGESAKVYRTQVGCLRVCKEGPIALIYPTGSWYRLVNEAAVDRIIESHILQGVPVTELLFAENREIFLRLNQIELQPQGQSGLS